MKFFLFIAIFTTSLPLFGQTMEARLVKEQMLQRATRLERAAQIGEQHFKDNELNDGCLKVEEIFREMPDHLTSIMYRMNMFETQVQKIRDESLDLLREMHMFDNRCKNGADYQFIDPVRSRKRMREVRKTLKNHAKQIKRRETDYQNSYYYYYDFNSLDF
jgi:hypothetical protein